MKKLSEVYICDSCGKKYVDNDYLEKYEYNGIEEHFCEDCYEFDSLGRITWIAETKNHKSMNLTDVILMNGLSSWCGLKDFIVDFEMLIDNIDFDQCTDKTKEVMSLLMEDTKEYVKEEMVKRGIIRIEDLEEDVYEQKEKKTI